jgi:hypothetical protein
VEEASLKGVHNGALIARAEAEFDLLVTADKNLRYQQNLVRTRLAIIELPFNSWPRLRLFGPMIGACLERIKPGEYVALGET